MEFGDGNADDGKLGNPGIVETFDSESGTECSESGPPHASFSCEYTITWIYWRCVKRYLLDIQMLIFFEYIRAVWWTLDIC